MEDTCPREGAASTLDIILEESEVSILVADKIKKDANVSIRIDPKWVDSIRSKNLISPAIIKSSSASNSCSIHRVPQCFQQHNEKAYLPQVISIGPFHHAQRRDDLRAMEEHKWRYLRSILGRNGDNCLELYLIAIKSKEERIRQCYSEKIDLTSNALVEMMVLDGCFMIELFHRATLLKNKKAEYKDDPILQLWWLRDNLMRDLVMLENQIPFFVLKCLLDLMGISVSYLASCALEFFTFSMVKRRYECHLFPKIQHLLHLLHFSLRPRPMEKNLKKKHSSKGDSHFINKNLEGSTIEMIHCASDLEQAGIKFKNGRAACKFEENFLSSKLRKRKNTLKEDSKGEEFHSFLDIKFQKGVIEIPTLNVEDSTIPLFLNLVAFEQCYCHCKVPYFTGYTCFMDCLIDSEKDVKIPCQNEIIDRWLGSNQDVAAFFNKLGREVILCRNDLYLREVFDNINQFYRSVWHVWGASLKHNYFNNPWTIISVIAGIFLLLLTFSQSSFSAFPKFAFDKQKPQPSTN